MTYEIWPWPLAITMCVFLIVIAFIAAVKIGATSPNAKLTAENRALKAAIRDVLAAQDTPPGNWDAVDRLRELDLT